MVFRPASEEMGCPAPAGNINLPTESLLRPGTAAQTAVSLIRRCAAVTDPLRVGEQIGFRS